MTSGDRLAATHWPPRNLRRFVAMLIYFLAVGWGIQAAIASEESKAPLVLSFALSVTCTFWCYADARSRGLSLVWPARLAIFFLWPVAVPVYLVWSRGTRGVLTAAVTGAIWIVVAFTAFMAAGYAAYGNAWFGLDR
jgi:hypothetical protein